jgi:hypothetical protein
MEQIIAFVLGISAGLFVITLIGLYRDVLKMKKEMAQASADIQDAFKNLEEFDRIFNQRLEGFYESTHNDLLRINEDLRKIIEDLSKHEETQRNKDFSTLMEKNTEVAKYVDKRIDQTTSVTREYVDKRVENTVDVLCTRMDIKFEEKPEYKNIPVSGEIKTNELLKS